MVLTLVRSMIKNCLFSRTTMRVSYHETMDQLAINLLIVIYPHEISS